MAKLLPRDVVKNTSAVLGSLQYTLLDVACNRKNWKNIVKTTCYGDHCFALHTIGLNLSVSLFPTPATGAIKDHGITAT
jgi:hypothetical protein